MDKMIREEFEDLKAFQRNPSLPKPLPPEKDTDDYEEFDDDAEMMQALWEKGVDAFEEELMAGEDY